MKRLLVSLGPAHRTLGHNCTAAAPVPGSGGLFDLPGAGYLSPVPPGLWRGATRGDLGVQWRDAGLDFFGRGNENSIPVYTVADGLLTRFPDWDDGVAIQHDDPLQPGEKVWSYYVAQDFPPGSVNVPVKAEQLLGYQGRWSGQPSSPMWIHLRFSVMRAAEDGSFPDEVGLESVLDPSPYLDIALKAAEGDSGWQPLRCKEE